MLAYVIWAVIITQINKYHQKQMNGTHVCFEFHQQFTYYGACDQANECNVRMLTREDFGFLRGKNVHVRQRVVVDCYRSNDICVNNIDVTFNRLVPCSIYNCVEMEKKIDLCK